MIRILSNSPTSASSLERQANELISQGYKLVTTKIVPGTNASYSRIILILSNDTDTQNV